MVISSHCERPTLALLLLLLLSMPLASAQGIFKSTMPDGRVIYGEKPVAGAAQVETLEPPPPTTGVLGLTPEERARAEQLARERAAAATAARAKAATVEEARKQLREAEAAREAGREPLPTERIGLAGGGTRLTEAYHARQKKLEEAVQAARNRLSEALQLSR